MQESTIFDKTPGTVYGKSSPVSTDWYICIFEIIFL